MTARSAFFLVSVSIKDKVESESVRLYLLFREFRIHIQGCVWRDLAWCLFSFLKLLELESPDSFWQGWSVQPCLCPCGRLFARMWFWVLLTLHLSAVASIVIVWTNIVFENWNSSFQKVLPPGFLRRCWPQKISLRVWQSFCRHKRPDLIENYILDSLVQQFVGFTVGTGVDSRE